ncbi:MAG: hypothetical protein IJX00_00355 [Clostridia bacterium]|nr:hypothetical protein [Clostridia bacterium]
MEIIYYVKNQKTLNGIRGEKILEKLSLLKKEVGDKYLIHVMTENNNETSASTLSKVDSFLKEKYKDNIKLIDDGYSTYYNRNLYPVFNLFETKLRKLLYLCNLTNPEKQQADQINNIDQLDFGKLFEFLFTTENFNNECKMIINSKDHRYSKKELIDKLSLVKEETVWSKLVGISELETLQENYLEIKNYRNDVMHAHNMPSEKYWKIKEMMNGIQLKLELLINKMFDIAPDQSVQVSEYSKIGKLVNQKFKEYVESESYKNYQQQVTTLVNELKLTTDSDLLKNFFFFFKEYKDKLKGLDDKLFESDKK